MYMTITLNGIDFKVWASTVVNAVKKAIKMYSKDNQSWSGYALVDGEKFNTYIHC